jgi:hypothetical protein
MLDKLKANWFNILLALVGLLSSADAAVGIRGGKSPMNITVIPSILVALGAGGTLGVKWLNGRTVVTRAVKQGLSPDLLERLENLYGLARDPDVTPDHASHLAGMAGDLLLAEHRRAKLEQAKIDNPVQVLNVPSPKSNDRIAEIIRKTLEEGVWSVPAEKADAKQS